VVSVALLGVIAAARGCSADPRCVAGRCAGSDDRGCGRKACLVMWWPVAAVSRWQLRAF
jgi:hypothetical protein